MKGCFGSPFLFGLVGIRRGRPVQSDGKKHAGGMFFSPGGESFGFRTHPLRMWTETKIENTLTPSRYSFTKQKRYLIMIMPN